MYEPCRIYRQVMSHAGQLYGCGCCDGDLPYKFMYGLLKKKAVDMSIGCGYIEQACVFFNRFFGDATCASKTRCRSCGTVSSFAGGSSTTVSFGDRDEQTEPSSNVKPKKCGCNG